MTVGDKQYPCISGGGTATVPIADPSELVVDAALGVISIRHRNPKVGTAR
jgi:hypothetical protein